MLGTLFAKTETGGSANIKEALGQLEDSSRSFLVISAMFLFLGGLVFGGIAAILHYTKKSEGMWKKIKLICMILGGLCIGLAIIGIILYVLTPFLIKMLIPV